jgi:hypothetical protein
MIRIKFILKLLLDIILKPHKIYRIYVVNEKKQVLEAKLYKDFQKDFEEFNKNVKEQEKAKKENLYPCLLDKTTDTELEPTYFYQDAWAFELWLILGLYRYQ